LAARKKKWTFDHCFAGESTNADIHAGLVEPLVASAMLGYNCCVFAYGQTGSGKTHTIVGDSKGRDPGLLPRALGGVFDRIKAADSTEFHVKVSYCELCVKTECCCCCCE